jgi:hypothetical protein
MPSSDSTVTCASGLPPVLRPLFWDCDFSQLDWQTHRDFIVRRVLVEGDWDAVCWLRRELGDAGLREWILQHEGRALSPQQLRFWELILDLPKDEVDRWLQADARAIWEGRSGR